MDILECSLQGNTFHVILRDIIIEKIKSEGPISFHDYMEMCLYYPGAGYYTSTKEKIGRGGDFFTSSSLTPSFGAMIARQLEEMWVNTGKNEFTILEYGAGTGWLCHDIIDSLKKNPGFYEKLQYIIIEKSASMREIEKAHLHEKVSWVNSIKGIAPITGCILSNEMLDNFSIHQVVMQEALMEVFVDYQDGFKEALKEAGPELKNYFDELKIALPKGFRSEINLEAIQWIHEIAASLDKGYLLTIDYGNNSSGLYRESRKDGSMVCYNKHAVNEQPYDFIGDQDITTHVNFSALAHWGSKNGLDTAGFTTQSNFLQGLGFADYLNESSILSNNLRDHRNLAKIKYTMLVDMGTKFKVLIQSKRMDNKSLMGLQFPGLSL